VVFTHNGVIFGKIMDQPNQSLFNRTYLKILSWVVAIAIVVLTASNQDTTTPSATVLVENWAYLTFEEEMDQQLTLTYPVMPAYTEEQTQQRLALQSALTQASAKQSNLSIQWRDDRITLTLSLSNKQKAPLDIDSLLNDLTSSTSQYYPAALQRAIAERYLALNDIDEVALSNLKAQLPTFLPASIEQSTPLTLFTQRPTVLLVMKEEQPSLIEPVLKQLKTRYSQTGALQTIMPTKSQKEPIRINLQHRSPDHLYLIGQAINTDANNLHRTLTFHYVNQAIQPLIESSRSRYRLLLKPASPLGYSALSITRDKAFNKAINNNLQSYLLKNFDNTHLAQIKTSLIQQHHEQLSTPHGRVKQLTNTLFQQEKLQSEDEFRDTLNDISAAQIQTNIERLFGPEHTIIVHITPP
jgi:hypothetical protein